MSNLPAPPDTTAVYKTLVFTDIKDSTSLWDAIGYAFQAVIERHDVLQREIARQLGGEEVATEGDSFMWVFDRAADAVEFAIRTLCALSAEPWSQYHERVTEVLVRIGIHTGPIKLGMQPETLRPVYTGSTASMGKRIQQVAHESQILLSDHTRQSVIVERGRDAYRFYDCGRHSFKGGGDSHLWYVLHPALPQEFEPVIGQPNPYSETEQPKKDKPYNQPETVRSTPKVLLHQRVDHALIGRDAEIEQIAQSLLHKQGVKRCVITGTPGMGKSFLAAAFAIKYQDEFPDSIFGFRADGDTVQIARACAGCCGLSFTGSNEDARSSEEAARTFMESQFSGRRTLLIFDNADDLDSIEKVLPSGNECAVIITTRDRRIAASFESHIDLPQLAPEASVTLLAQFLGDAGVTRIKQDMKAAQNLVERAGNLPKAVELLSKALKRKPHYPLTDFARELAEETTRLGSDREIKASLELSLKWLTPEEQIFFASLSVCGRQGVSFHAAQAACGTSKSETRNFLERMEELSLLDAHPRYNKHYIFHPLLHEYARERADNAIVNNAKLYDTAAYRHAQYFINVIKQSNMSTVTFMEQTYRDMENILLAVNWMKDQEAPDYAFVLKLEPMLEEFGYWQQAIALMQDFSGIARKRAEWEMQAQFTIHQARYERMQKRIQQADILMQAVPDIIANIHSDSARLHCEALYLNTLGIIRQEQKNFEEALTVFEQAITILKDLPESALLLAKVEVKVGGILRRQASRSKGKQKQALIAQAIAACERGRDLYQQLGDIRGKSKALNSLGTCYRDMHDAQSKPILEECVTIQQQLGNRRGLAIAHHNLGIALSQKPFCDYAAAMKQFRLSLEICEDISDRVAIRRLHKDIEELNNEVGKAPELFSPAIYPTVAKAYLAGLETARQEANPALEALYSKRLGSLYSHQGMSIPALTYLNKSAELFQLAGKSKEQAETLLLLAEIHLDQENIDAAIQSYEQSEVLANASGDDILNARVQKAKGDAFLQCNSLEPAIASYLQAFTLFRNAWVPHIGQLQLCESILNGLVEALLQTRRHQEALAYCDHARRLHPKFNALYKQTSQVRGTVAALAAGPQGRYGHIISEIVPSKIHFHETYLDTIFIAKLEVGLQVEVEIEYAGRVPRIKRQGNCRVVPE